MHVVGEKADRGWLGETVVSRETFIAPEEAGNSAYGDGSCSAVYVGGQNSTIYEGTLVYVVSQKLICCFLLLRC